MSFLDAFFEEQTEQTRSDKMYNDALRLFNTAALQNNTYDAALAAKIRAGADCDVIPGSTGSFGHVATNPIPVNGPFGELTYLSRLRVRATGSMVFFHKVRSIGAVDEFEVVNVSGRFADRLYFDMYHPRLSRMYPDRFTLEREAVFPRGITTTCPDFPKGLQKLIKKEAEQRLGVDVAEKESARIDIARARDSLRCLRKYSSPLDKEA
jgi:hypothetical protein